jgi:hypothetical protein
MSQQFLYFSDIRTADLLIQSENAAIDLVTNSLTSDHSKCAYSKPLTDFLAWMQASRKPLVKATIQEYRQTLTGAPASINLKMSTICKLATGAANGLLDETIANRVLAACIVLLLMLYVLGTG